MTFVGTWYICEMEMWDEDYFNMDVQAYIKIDSKNLGKFQFGLVWGEIDGKEVHHPDGDRFEFTFEGVDEGDPISGFGWIKLKEKDIVEGEFRLHLRNSTFSARRAK